MTRVKRDKKFKRRVAVIGDGFTEKIYFEQLKEVERIKGLVIIPELPKKSLKGGSYKKVISSAKSLKDKGYDHIYCLIDFDTVLSENKVDDFARELKKVDQDGITIFINNPCFETWILVHYERSGKEFENCGKVGKVLSGYLKNYSKKQKFLHSMNLYKTLRPHLLDIAIPNAEFLEKEREINGKQYPRAEVFKFFIKEKIIGDKKE